MPGVYGVMAEFDQPEALRAACVRARAAGFKNIEAYTPFPVEGLDEAIGFKKSRLPLFVLIAGIFGAIGGYAMQYYISVISYPVNIGGRPPHSWPAFIPVTFECTILCAALAAVFGMFVLNGLPMPYHPVFNSPRFQFASRDRFFLCLVGSDAIARHEDARRLLNELHALSVEEVDQ